MLSRFDKQQVMKVALFALSKCIQLGLSKVANCSYRFSRYLVICLSEYPKLRFAMPVKARSTKSFRCSTTFRMNPPASRRQHSAITRPIQTASTT